MLWVTLKRVLGVINQLIGTFLKVMYENLIFIQLIEMMSSGLEVWIKDIVSENFYL
jgi:hypothetical protein